MRVRHGLPLTGLLVLALARAAGAQSAPPERGTLLSVEAGDIACYVRIRDEKGQSRNWMADFAVCESADRLIGRAVALVWKTGQVQHPGCQGDTNCRRTQQVLLVTRLQPLPR